MKQEYVAVEKKGDKETLLGTGTRFKLLSKYPRLYFKDVEIITIEEYEKRKKK